MASPPVEPGASGPNPYAPPNSEWGAEPVEPARGAETLAWIALAAPAIAGLSSLVLVRADPLLSLVIGSFCLVTSIVTMAMDARRLRSGSTALWVLGAVMMFLIAFPLYMHRRTRCGAPWRLPHALVAMAIYLFGNLYPDLSHEQALVQVACHPSGPLRTDGDDCTATQQRGDAATTCFDLVLTCEGRESWREHACLASTTETPGKKHLTPEYLIDCSYPKLDVLEIVVTSR